MMYLRSRLIQIDVDAVKTPFGWLWYYLLKSVYSSHYYQYKIIGIYKTRHGWHIRLLPKKPLTKKQMLVIRAIMGDDPERLFMDETTKTDYDFNTLFSWKNGSYEEVINLES